MRKAVCALLIVLLSAFASFAVDESTKPVVNIGIFSVRSIDDNQKLWLPLGDQLHALAPSYEFNITSYTQVDMKKAVEANTLDFVVAQSIAFIEMETEYGVSNIASLIRKDKKSGKLLDSYSGVIFALSSRKDIKGLEDIRGKTIAATHENGFAADIMQREVLAQVGIDTKSDCKMLYTGQPVDRVIEALRSGAADVGIFKSKNIEEMVAKGKLKPDELFVINKKNHQNYPYLSSTPLYSEWAVAATKRATPELVKAVTVALYQIESEVSDEFHSFGIPLSYSNTRALMQKYHIYPYEQRFGLKDVLEHYAFQTIVFVLLLIISTTFAIYHYFSLRKITRETKKLEAILSTSADGIHVVDKDGKIVHFSDSFASMLGYTNEEMAELTIFDIDKHMTPELIRQAMENVRDNFVRFESKHFKKDATAIDVEISSKGVYIDDKYHIFASARDITERKKAEQELKESEERLRTIIEMEPECVKMIDANGRLRYMNPAGLDMIEARLEQVRGKKVLGIITPAYRRAFADMCKRVIEGERVHLIFETIGLKGKHCWLETTSVPMQIHGETVLLGVTRDITERKKMEEQLKSFTEELELKVAIGIEELRRKDIILAQQSKMAAMGEMIGVIAHQWKQPLNALSVTVQDIKEAYAFGEIDEKYIEKSVSDSMSLIKIMSQTIDDFRNFFRPDKKKEQFYIEEAIGDTLKIIDAQLKASGIKVIIDKDTKKHEYLCFKNELKHVFLNILANAKDALVATKSSNPFIKIEVGETENVLTISLEDSAGGIPDAIMDKIFLPHFTTKPADKGTGIGLYLSKEIVEQSLSGKLTVENTENGAKFIVELPK